ncbi:MAG TPA: acyltransferase [Polyangiaceae bacterium]|nr:acyltransferase [Polyangiaceae bacterium]
MAQARFHIPSLDGLRTFSFGIVFIAHAGLGNIVPGGFGVTVFFFLSGFLITTLMRQEWQKTGTVSLRHFYIRRALRILPPFYLVLFVACALTAAGMLPGQLGLHAVLAQALHVANYWVVAHGPVGFAPGTGVYWSLAVEEHFYFLFPLLYLLLRRLGASPARQAWALLSLCAAILLWRCVLVFGFHSAEDRTYVASDTRFDSILFGCLLAVYGNPILDAPKKSEFFWKYALLPLSICGLLASFLLRDPRFRETFRYSLQGIALIPVFVCAVRYPTWGVMRVLNYRPVVFVGGLSYSLYLIHQIVFIAFEEHLGATTGLLFRSLATLAVSLLLAWLVQVTIEKPCARLRRRFSD